MPRYTTFRPCARWSSDLEEEIAGPDTITVIEDDGEPQHTGLLDQHGNPLYRVKNRQPCGYCR
jgi:hypothetical protein